MVSIKTIILYNKIKMYLFFYQEEIYNLKFFKKTILRLFCNLIPLQDSVN
jgi:hypothetical protein